MSPVVHTAQQFHGQVGNVVVKFNVGSARIGPEKVKPLTYFALEVRTSYAPRRDQADDVQVQSDRSTDSNRSPTSADASYGWIVTTEPTSSDRRYSEFADMRKFLLYAFPWLIIPPLPPKSGVEGMKTFMADYDSLIQQHANLRRFMIEIASIPAVLECPVFQQFAQLPRDHHDFHALMDSIRKKNNENDDVRGIINGYTDGATKAVKGLYTAVSGWISKSMTSSTTAGGRQNIPADFDERVAVQLASSNAYRSWAGEIESLKKLKVGVEEAIPSVQRFLEEQRQMYAACREFGDALEQYGSELGACPMFGDFSRDFAKASTLTKGITAEHDQEFRRDEAAVLGAMIHEAQWLAAAIEAAQSMQHVIKAKIESDVIKGRSPEHDAPPATPSRPSPVLDDATRMEQCFMLHGALASEIVRFRTQHQHRMRKAAEARCRHALHYLSEEQVLFEKHSLPREVKDPHWAERVYDRFGSDVSQSFIAVNSEQVLEQRETALEYFRGLQKKK